MKPVHIILVVSLIVASALTLNKQFNSNSVDTRTLTGVLKATTFPVKWFGPAPQVGQTKEKYMNISVLSLETRDNETVTKADGFPGPKTLWIGLQRVPNFILALEAQRSITEYSIRANGCRVQAGNPTRHPPKRGRASEGPVGVPKQSRRSGRARQIRGILAPHAKR